MARKAYIKLNAEVTEGDAYTVFKSMRNTLKADKVEMETIEKPSEARSSTAGPPRCRVTGYFWADVVLDHEEVTTDAQGDS